RSSASSRSRPVSRIAWPTCGSSRRRRWICWRPASKPAIEPPTSAGRPKSVSGIPGVTALRADARRVVDDGHLGTRTRAAQAKLDPGEVILFAWRLGTGTLQPMVFGIGLMRQEIVPGGECRHLEFLERRRLVILVGPAD